VLDPHAAQDKRPTFRQAVGVVSDADAHTGSPN
jgi:hypothetical protein